MNDLELLAAQLANTSLEQARTSLVHAFERADFSRLPGAQALVEALCIVDDQQFELDVLGGALGRDPGCDFLLVAYLTTTLRSGVLFSHDKLDDLAATHQAFRLWARVLQTLAGAPPLDTPAFAACLREARRVLETGGTVNLSPS